MSKLSQKEKIKAKIERETEQAKESRAQVLGIGSKSIINFNNLMYVRLVLLALLPLAFFMYSRALFAIIIVYALLMIPTRIIEKRASEFSGERLRLPKLDLIVALSLIGVVVFLMFLSIVTTNNRPFRFEGYSSEQVREWLLDEGSKTPHQASELEPIITNGGLTLTRGQRYFVQGSTLFVGDRTIFGLLNGNGWGRNNAIIGYHSEIDTNPRDTFGEREQGVIVIRPDGGTAVTVAAGDYSAVISENRVASNIIQFGVILNIVLLAGVFFLGIMTVAKMRRLRLGLD